MHASNHGTVYTYTVGSLKISQFQFRNPRQELRELCKEHGLSHVGKKGEMVERLVAFRGGEAATDPTLWLLIQVNFC